MQAKPIDISTSQAACIIITGNTRSLRGMCLVEREDFQSITEQLVTTASLNESLSYTPLSAKPAWPLSVNSKRGIPNVIAGNNDLLMILYPEVATEADVSLAKNTGGEYFAVTNAALRLYLRSALDRTSACWGSRTFIVIEPLPAISR